MKVHLACIDWEQGHAHFAAGTARGMYERVARRWVAHSLENAPEGLRTSIQKAFNRDAWRKVVEEYFDWAGDPENDGDSPRQKDAEYLTIEVLDVS